MKVYKATSDKSFEIKSEKIKMCCININLTVLTNIAYEIFVHNCYMPYQNKTLYNKVFFSTNFIDVSIKDTTAPRQSLIM